jgi:hypothetical protein
MPELSMGQLGMERAGQVLLAGVDKAVASRWEHAVRTAEATAGQRTKARIKQVTKAYGRELAMVGAATGAAAALPVTGTGTAIVSGIGEFGWFTMRAADLILAIAAIHGHTEESVEQRRAWVLSILVFGEGAAEGFNRLAAELGKGLGGRATRAIPAESLQVINRALGGNILTKYGKKRGVVALGTALPLGIGAAVGGSANYAMVRGIAHQADAFFAQLPPGLAALPA